jgi:hypothetical protein
MCIDLTHGIPFDQNYNIWTFIHYIWGIEIKILRNEGNNVNEIIQEMDKQLKIPTKIETSEKAEIRENRRRERIDLESVSNGKEIEDCLKDNDIKWANEYRFTALMRMIGYTETGFFPQLNKDKEIIENRIKNLKNYIEEIIK